MSAPRGRSSHGWELEKTTASEVAVIHRWVNADEPTLQLLLVLDEHVP